MKNKKYLLGKSAKGFTLVELLVVMSIIGVLATLAVTSLGSVRVKARDIKRVYDLRQIGLAMDLYYSDHRMYPQQVIPGEPIQADFPSETLYMSMVPHNPSPRADSGCPDNDYIYYKVTATNTYVIAGCLGSPQGELTEGPIGYHTDRGLISCGGFLPDREGNVYRTVQVGNQCWMADNLKNLTYPNGACINGGEAPCLAEGPNRMCYGNNPANCETHGALYTWSAAMSGSDLQGARGLCPIGWRIPTHDDFTVLERELCNIEENGNCTVFPFDDSTTGKLGTNEAELLKVGGGFPFNASFTGFYNKSSLQFLELNQLTSFWSSTSYGASMAWTRQIDLATEGIARFPEQKENRAYSVRCVKL